MKNLLDAMVYGIKVPDSTPSRTVTGNAVSQFHEIRALGIMAEIIMSLPPDEAPKEGAYNLQHTLNYIYGGSSSRSQIRAFTSELMASALGVPIHRSPFQIPTICRPKNK